MKRREFLTSTLAAGLAAAALAQEAPMADLPRRPYGKDGVTLPIIGFGGIVVMNETPEDAARYVSAAYDQGVDYFDVAPTYGNAEERLGPALEPYRDRSFLACKTEKRDAAEGRAALENSLRLLRTDHFDLYQLHSLTTDEDIERAFGPGGVMEVAVAAKEQGLTRYLGFSAHSDEAAVRALELYDFDSILFPLNCVTMMKGDFGHRALAKAQEKGASILALKGLAWGRWEATAQARSDKPKAWYQPITDPDLGRLSLSYTLGLPITAAVPPGDWESFELALSIARGYQPLNDEELARLRERVQFAAPIFESAEA